MTTPLQFPDPNDTRITSVDLDGVAPWLALDAEVPLAHLLGAANAVERTPDQVRARLAELGYTALPQGPLPEAVEPDDVLIVSKNLDDGSPWLEVGEPVSLVHVLAAANAVERTPEQVRARLAELGYGHVPEGELPAQVSEDDLRIVSADLDGESPWLETGEPVSLVHVLAAANAVERTPEQVRARLAELGYGHVPEGELPA
ncbi:hypothetical protein, partial [Nocardiopsis ansamitocini]|uniref:wHTH domain-containing protein n=1 Tax=Nocardiopsis ansamitocini TaxID=1670832 RepID=UPI002552C305